MFDRRRFVSCVLGLEALAGARLPRFSRARAEAVGPVGAGFRTRGVVLVPEDLTLEDWPERAKNAGLTTIGIHHQNSPGAVVEWIGRDAGRKFLETCGRLGLEVEYELHAMRELLPRALFAKRPEWFRMDERGRRVPDANLCVHAPGALETAAENALALARALRSTTGRYFFWGDDGRPWCHCPRCRALSDSDQALLLENHLVRALCRVNPSAQLAHLAYTNTLAPPVQVRPEPGIFLEYAPIERRYDQPFEKQSGPDGSGGLSALDANLRVFPAATARVLEYWLDVSRFSRWKRPAARLPWRPDVLRADLSAYAKRGVRHVSSFAVYIDADYSRRFGDLKFLKEYGEILAGRPPRPGAGS